jgi:hypothetical protein
MRNKKKSTDFGAPRASKLTIEVLMQQLKQRS